MTAQINRMTYLAQRVRDALARGDALATRTENVSLPMAETTLDKYESGLNVLEAAVKELDAANQVFGNIPPLETDSQTPQKASPVAQNNPAAILQPISVQNPPALNPAPPRTIGFPNSSLVRHGT